MDDVENPRIFIGRFNRCGINENCFLTDYNF
jgi:hypothetical protein